MCTLRSIKQLSIGALEAPAGNVTIVFMNAVGARSLLAWDNDVASKALEMYQKAVMHLLQAHSGYMVRGNWWK